MAVYMHFMIICLAAQGHTLNARSNSPLTLKEKLNWDQWIMITYCSGKSKLPFHALPLNRKDTDILKLEVCIFCSFCVVLPIPHRYLWDVCWTTVYLTRQQSSIVKKGWPNGRNCNMLSSLVMCFPVSWWILFTFL